MVLVTGASGFLGRHVVSVLRNSGHRVRVLVRPSTDVRPLNWPADIEIFRADLSADDNLAAAFDDVEILVHLAAQVRGDDQARISTTLAGTERLMNAMATSATKRLVLASSFSVYDYRKIRATLDESASVEDADLADRDGYAIAKTVQEQMVRHYARQHGWELSVLRPGVIWGRGHLDLPNLGQRVGPLYFIISPGAILPLSYAENCAEAFAKAVTSTGNLTINVIDDELVTAWQYAGDYLRRTRQAAIRIPVPYRLGLTAGFLAGTVRRVLFRGKLALPGILRPRCFEARFKPLSYSNAVLHRTLDWKPRFTYAQAWDRVLEPAPAHATGIPHA